MTEPITFEDRIAEQLRAFAAPAARPPRPEAVANAVEAARNVRGDVPGELRWPRLGRLSMAVAAVAAAVVVAVVAVEILGSLPNQPSASRGKRSRISAPQGAAASNSLGSTCHA